MPKRRGNNNLLYLLLHVISHHHLRVLMLARQCIGHQCFQLLNQISRRPIRERLTSPLKMCCNNHLGSTQAFTVQGSRSDLYGWDLSFNVSNLTNNPIVAVKIQQVGTDTRWSFNDLKLIENQVKVIQIKQRGGSASTCFYDISITHADGLEVKLKSQNLCEVRNLMARQLNNPTRIGYQADTAGDKRAGSPFFANKKDDYCFDQAKLLAQMGIQQKPGDCNPEFDDKGNHIVSLRLPKAESRNPILDTSAYKECAAYIQRQIDRYRRGRIYGGDAYENAFVNEDFNHNLDAILFREQKECEKDLSRRINIHIDVNSGGDDWFRLRSIGPNH
jgi:hypothetical protein